MSGFRAVYYPDCYPRSLDAFANMCLYFDEVHFVSVGGNEALTGNYTQYLKNLSTETTLLVHGNLSRPEVKREVERVQAMYKFALRIKPLLCEVVHYHPNLLIGEVTQVVRKLRSGEKVSLEEFEALITGESEEGRALEEFAREHPTMDESSLKLLLPSARYLARTEGFLPVSDVPELPAPVVQPLGSSARELAAAIAEQCVELMVPESHWTGSEDILELRAALRDELEAFQVMMLRLAGKLRGLVGTEPDRDRVAREARFLVETDVVPHVHAIERRVAMEKGKLWRKMFGTVLSWAPLWISSYMDPTGVSLAQAVKKAAGDMKELLGAAHDVTIAGDPGLSLLFNLRKKEQRASLPSPC